MALSAAGLLALSSSTQAADGIWQGTTDATWAGANWSASPAPGTGETATFNLASATVNANTTIDLGAGITIGTILFDTASAAAYTIGSGVVGSQTLTLSTAGAITMSATVANNELFNANISLDTAGGAQGFTVSNNSITNGMTIAGGVSTAQTGTKTLVVTGAGGTTISGAISDGSGQLALSKTGVGTLTLTGSNNFSGGTTVSGGILNYRNTAARSTNSATNVSAAGSLGLGVGGAGFFASADVDALWANTLANVTMDAASGVAIDTTAGNFTYGTSQSTRSLAKLGANTLTLTGAHTYTGVTTISGGTLQLGDGTTGNDGSIAGASIVNNATLAFNRFGSSSYGGVISGTGAVTKTGAGTQALSGANTYSGSTTVSNGTVTAGNDTALGGATAAGLSMNPATGNTATVGFTSAAPAIGSLASSGAGTSNVVLGNIAAPSATALTAGGNNASTIFGGVISDGTVSNAAAIGSLTKTGTGVMILTGANTYTGGTTVAGGVLDYRSTAARPAIGTTTVLAAGTLGLGVGGAGFFSASDVDALWANTLANVSMNAASGVALDTTAGNFTYATSQSTRSLVKLGANTLTLTGSNTFTGATSINGGELNLGAAENAGVSGPLGVGTIFFAGGTLQYSAANQFDYSSRIGGGTSAISIDTNGQNVAFASALTSSNSGGFTKSGGGTLTLNGAAVNTYTGPTAVRGGTLSLDFNNLATPTDLITPTSALQLGGGTLQVLGKADVATSQTFASTALQSGTNGVSVAPLSGSTNPTLALGTIGVATGGTLRFAGPATSTGVSTGGVGQAGAEGGVGFTPATGTISVTNALGTNSALKTAVSGAFATVGLYDFAAGSGATPFTVIGLSQGTGGTAGFGAYTNVINGRVDANGSGANIDVTGGGNASLSGAGTAVQDVSLRFNSAAAITLDWQFSANVALSGVLVTPNVGANNIAFVTTGTSLARAPKTGNRTGAAGTMAIWQNNSGGLLRYDNGLANNGLTNNNVSQNGSGTVVYGVANNSLASNFRGQMFLNGGVAEIANNNALGGSASIATPIANTPVTLNGGTLVATTSLTLNDGIANPRPVSLQVNGGGLGALAGSTLTVDGVIGNAATGAGALVIGVPASAANGNILGQITGTGTGTANAQQLATGTVALTGNTNTYTGGTVLNSGTLQIKGINPLGGANYGGLTFNGGTVQYATSSSGSGTLDLTTSATSTVRIGALGGTLDINGNSVTYANGITGVSGGTLTIADSTPGANALTISGSSSLSSAINVTAGTVHVTGTLNASGGVIAAGGLVDGTGTLGPVSLTTGTLATGTAASNFTGQLTVGALTSTGLGGSTSNVNQGGAIQIGVFGSSVGRLFASSATFTSPTPFLYSLGTGVNAPVNGVYTILSSASSLGSPTLSATTIGRLSLTPAVSGNDIQLTVLGTPGTLFWNNGSGGGGNGIWNVQTSPNFLNTTPVGGGPAVQDTFFAGDGVTFNDTNNGGYAVTLDSAASPSSLAVSNSAGDYVISGSGSISGVTNLVKSGTSKLTLSTVNGYSGGTTVNAGTMALGATNALPTAGAVTVQGAGTLDLAGFDQTIASLADGGVATGTITNSGALHTLTLNNVSANGFSGTISGNVSLALNPSSSTSVTLSGANSYAGTTTLSRGTLIASSNSALGAASGTSGGLVLNPSTGTATANFTSAAPAIASLSNSGAGTSSVVLGNATGGTATTLTVSGTGAGTGVTNSFAGVISDLSGTNSAAIGHLTVSGGALALTGANTFTGTTNVTGGTLTLGSALALQNSSLSPAGGTINFDTLTAATLGGLTGGTGQTLALTNTTPAAVALTVGNHNITSTYTGTLTGLGSVLKLGSGTTTLGSGTGGLGTSGGATYSGNTTVQAGTLVIGGSSNLAGTIDVTAPSIGNVPFNANLIVADNAVINSPGTILLTSNTGGLTTVTQGIGTMTVRDNASVTAAGFQIGGATNSHVPLGNLFTLQDSAAMTVNGTFDLLRELPTGGTGNGTATTVNLNGGTLAVNRVIRTGGFGTHASVFNFNGGLLKALASDPSPTDFFFGALGNTTANVLTGGARIDTNSFAVTIAQVLAGTGGSVTKFGAGTLTLGGASTYDGTVTVTEGTLAVASLANGGAASGLGSSSSAASNVLLANGTTLSFRGATDGATDRSFTINGTAAGHGATLDSSGTGAVSFTGSVTPAYGTVDQARTLTLGGTNAGFNMLAANLADNGAGVVSVVKTGTGAWSLTGINAYTGTTLVGAGTLKFSQPAALYNGAQGSWTAANITVSSGAALGFNVGGAGEFTAPQLNVLLPLGTGPNGFQTGSFAELDTTGGDFAYSGTIGDTNSGTASRGLIKAGSNVLTLSGTNTYTGPTVVNAGTLKFAQRSSLYNGMEGSWTAANITVKSGAALGLNVGGAGQFTASDLEILLPLGTGTNGFQTGAFVELDTTGGSFAYGGVIGNTNLDANVLGLRKAGANSLTLNAANTFTGDTVIAGGTLLLGNASALQRSVLNYDNQGGLLDFGALTSAVLGGLEGTQTLPASATLTSLSLGNSVGNDADYLAAIGNGANPLAVTKIGTNTQTLSALNHTYTGATAVEGGTLVVNGSLSGTLSVSVSAGAELRFGLDDILPNTAPVTLGSNNLTFARLNPIGFDDTLGALTLGGFGEILLSGGDSVLRFADSSAQAPSWTGTLQITNWGGLADGGGSEQLFFGVNANGLTPTQLALVQFLNPEGFDPGVYGAQILATGELVVAVPEPGAILSLFGGLGMLLGLRRLRRKS